MTHPEPTARHKPTRLFVVLGGLFIANALVAEFIGVKIFALEETLGFAPWRYRLFGVDAAPQFTLAGSDGNSHSLADLRGRHVVIAFFPKAFTRG